MQIRITDGNGTTTELIGFAEPDTDAEAYQYTDLDGDRLAIFTAVIPDLGAGINLGTDQRGSSLPLADVPALVEAIWTKAQQAAHQEGQLPCPSPNCPPCTADTRLAASERQGHRARRKLRPSLVAGLVDAARAQHQEPSDQLLQLTPELAREAADAIENEAARGPKAGLTRIYMRGLANRIRQEADQAIDQLNQNDPGSN